MLTRNRGSRTRTTTWVQRPKSRTFKSWHLSCNKHKLFKGTGMVM